MTLDDILHCVGLALAYLMFLGTSMQRKDPAWSRSRVEKWRLTSTGSAPMTQEEKRTGQSGNLACLKPISLSKLLIRRRPAPSPASPPDCRTHDWTGLPQLLHAEMNGAGAFSVKCIPVTHNRWKRWLQCCLSVFSFCVSQIKNVKVCYAKGRRRSMRPGIAVPGFEVVSICFWSATHSPALAACILYSTLQNDIQSSSTLSSKPQTLLQAKS